MKKSKIGYAVKNNGTLVLTSIQRLMKDSKEAFAKGRNWKELEALGNVCVKIRIEEL